MIDLEAGGAPVPVIPGVEDDPLLAAIEGAGLRGRGGAGFPAWLKLRSVRDRARELGVPPVVVANGEEGEPGSVKDKYLLRHRPHEVLDGLVHSARIIGAERGYVYLSDREGADSIAAALRERADGVPIEIIEVEHAYVAGEESAVVRRIDGGPALPTAKPPRPFEKGVGGAPTLVSNVDTLTRIAALARGQRTDRLLVTVSGADVPPRLYDVAEGTPLRSVVEAHFAEAGRDRATRLRAVMLGGLFGGIHTPDVLETPLSFTALADAGAALGCGAIHLVGTAQCPVAVIRNALNHLAEQSARQCGVCVTGTSRLAATMTRMARGSATEADRDALIRWSAMLPGRGACGLLDAAARLAGSLMAHFPEVVAAHLPAACPVDPGCAVHGDWGLRGSCPGCSRASGPSSIAVPVVPHPIILP